MNTNTNLPSAVTIDGEEVTVNLDDLEEMAKEFNKNKVSKSHRVNERNRKKHILEAKRRQRDNERAGRKRNRK